MAALKPFFSDDPSQRRLAARTALHEIVVEGDAPDLTAIEKALFALSVSGIDGPLSNYATLDQSHADDISEMIARIEQYIDDPSFERPLNFLMLASPGAGKSHFIKCLAKSLESREVKAVTFNMAGMASGEELSRPLDDVRNAKVEDRMPLLFLDEFDSAPSNYGLLLPLLWDGELSLGRRDLKVGKLVIVLAGSGAGLIEALDHAKSMKSDVPIPIGTTPKLIDLFSRINGKVVRIPPFHDAVSNIDRRTDKVAIATHLLRQRFGEHLKYVPIALLRFISRARFRYDVRSIDHLASLIPFKPGLTRLTLKHLSLPLNSTEALRASSLAYHLVDDDDYAHGIIDLWKDVCRCRELVQITPNEVAVVQYMLTAESHKRGDVTEAANLILAWHLDK